MSPPAFVDAALAALARLVGEHGLEPRGLLYAGPNEPSDAAWRALRFARVVLFDPRAGRLGMREGEVSGCNVLVVDLGDPRHAMAARAVAALDRLDAVLTVASAPRALAGIDRILFDRGFLRLADAEEGSPVVAYLRSSLIRTPNATGGRTRAVITMSHFGHHAGFANQLFQYAFLKLYGLRNNCAVEIPDWVGEQVYGIPARRIARRLREYRGDEWSVRDLALWKRNNPPVNVDFWGYYQNIPANWRPHRVFLRRLFEPLPPWRAPLERWLAAHRPAGTTLVALHVRRGDYRHYPGKAWFRLIPEAWYKRWLSAIWPTLANPVLFIATDECDTVLPHFAEYRPLTAEALEADMPEPRLLADFQILAAADVLAICNSSFSRMAALLADPAQRCVIAEPEVEGFVPYDPWAADLFWRRYGAPPTVLGRSVRLPRWLHRRIAG